MPPLSRQEKQYYSKKHIQEQLGLHSETHKTSGGFYEPSIEGFADTKQVWWILSKVKWGNNSRIARVLGVDRSTVKRWGKEGD